MAGLSPTGQTNVLNSILNSSTISLHTADPGNTGTSEVSGNGYGRQSATFTPYTGSNPTTASNQATVTFTNTGSGGWGNISYFGVWISTNFQGSGPLSAPKTIAGGDQLRFLGGAITVTAQ